jgi:WD40 repeat protein
MGCDVEGMTRNDKWSEFLCPTTGSQDFPIRAWQEHTREVFSVDWSNVRKDMFVTASWDATVKVVRLVLIISKRFYSSYLVLMISGHQSDPDLCRLFKHTTHAYIKLFTLPTNPM